MNTDIRQRLAAPGVLPEFQVALLTLLDLDAMEKSSGRAKAHDLFRRVYVSLGGNDDPCLQILLDAWHTLMSAIVRLDHLQDHDPMELPLPSNTSVGAQYNLIVGYYTVAWAMLDRFGPEVPIQRIQAIRELWGDFLIRAFSGQQRDLMPAPTEQSTINVLDQYQEVVRAKAGAFYALAFGSVAALAIDDIASISALIQVGEIFGMLEQFNDDLLDAEEQTTDYTLPRAYQIAMQDTPSASHELMNYWRYICRTYIEHLQKIIVALPVNVQALINEIFNVAFGTTGTALNTEQQ